jgi:hypothetical protein
MARGFESKAVADQQESALERRRAPTRQRPVIDQTRLARVRRLELARADIERRLALATVPALRQTLERALRALQDDLRALQ